MFTDNTITIDFNNGEDIPEEDIRRYQASVAERYIYLSVDQGYHLPDQERNGDKVGRKIYTIDSDSREIIITGFAMLENTNYVDTPEIVIVTQRNTYIRDVDRHRYTKSAS